MRKYSTLLAGLLLIGCGTAKTEPDRLRAGQNVAATEERTQIEALLDNYVISVSTGNSMLFESQLLDLSIPFASIGSREQSVRSADLKGIQDYQGFKKAIFDSGNKFQQRFSQVRIEQVGNLAQVSLDYETALKGNPYAGKGWKVLQLIKVQGSWKIASEFFTGYPQH